MCHSSVALQRTGEMALSPLISEMSAQPGLDDRGHQIISAAITMRDTTGRELKRLVRAMCPAWGVSRTEKIDGKWKDKRMDVLIHELTSAICAAGDQWKQDRARGPAEQGPCDTQATKKARTEDQASLGEALEPPQKKLRVSAADTDAEEEPSTGAGSSCDRAAAAQLGGDALGHRPDLAGAPRGSPDPHVHSRAAEPAAAASGSVCDPTERQQDDAAEVVENMPDLFRDATPDDIARVRWLRAHTSDAKCKSLLLQICEWKNQARDAARQLARQQEISMTRQTRGTINGMMDVVREHFREAIALQRSRLATWKRLPDTISSPCSRTRL